MRFATGFVLGMLLMAGGASAQTVKVLNASGRVTAVSKDSITIQTSKQTLVIFVDSATKVVGKGVGSATSALKAQGRSPSVGDLVGEFDSVKVRYAETEAGRPRASEIRIVVKGFKKS